MYGLTEEGITGHTEGSEPTERGFSDFGISVRTDLNKFLELSNDPYWRQQAEERLKALGAR